MTVEQLKEKLKTMDDNCVVQVGVRAYTQAHAVAYLEVFSADRAGTGCTLWISFPKGTVVSKQKKAAIDNLPDSDVEPTLRDTGFDDPPLLR